jgi:hypothetical protein
MNRLLITGLGIGKALGLCDVCNLNFDWLIYNPSTLLWADRILIPENSLDYKGKNNEKFNAIIQITLETLDKKNILEKLPSKIQYSEEDQTKVYTQLLKDRNCLLENFPETIKEIEDNDNKEFFIDDIPFCAPYIASLYGAIELAKRNNAQCLFNKRDYLYLRYLNGIKGKNNDKINQIYEEVFSTLLPNDSIVPQFAIDDEKKCSSCVHEKSCKEKYDNYSKTLNKILETRNFDDFLQARNVVNKIISKKDEIRDDKDVAEVIESFNEKKNIINRNINKLFPKIKRWTNMATIISTPLTITTGILSALQNTNPVIPIASGSVLGIVGAINKTMENYTESNRWVSFLDKNK